MTSKTTRSLPPQPIHRPHDPTIFAHETGNELGRPIFGDMWMDCGSIRILNSSFGYAGGHSTTV
ncbi:hypothetical protein BDR03DRAFT_998644, partial [Suillus americanus]